MGSSILIVDDDPLICKLFTTALNKSGYRAQAVMSGRAAIEHLQSETIDLLVLDIMMADMDGISVIQHLRQQQGYENLPILVLSARVDEASMRRGIAAGATQYLTKPITPAALVRRIQEVLGH